MSRLREALAVLLDESRPIVERLNQLVPARGPAYVPGLSRAVLTPILLITHPDKYSVWNRMSEEAEKALGIWPRFDRGTSFGEKYEMLNDLHTQLAGALGVNRWTLDALWWRVQKPTELPEGSGVGEGGADTEEAGHGFGLEKHLQDFLRDNWDSLPLGKDWTIEMDGDPEAGVEYSCQGGWRIDILARHRTKAEWLVIELKRDQTSDETIGQVLRYMGWVTENLAETSDAVRGLIIAREADAGFRYALARVPDVELQRYQVHFELVPSS
jgi:hypothetical protein